MSEWKETNLGAICTDISYGYTASATSEKVGPKFLRITDIVPDRINWDTVPFCLADKEIAEKYELKNGDIVIARTGATTGYNKIIKNLNFSAVFASYLIRYKIDENKAYPEYIGHILQSPNWYEFIDAIAGGSAQPGANAKELASFEILLPPLPEQKAIATVLSSLDDKIDLLHRQNKTLEGLAETLFRQWFIEEAQDDWEEKKFGDLVVETIGGDWGEEIPTKDSVPVICLRGVDLQKIKDNAHSSDAPLRYIKPSSLEKRKLSDNDILLAASGIGPIGKTLPINKNMLDAYEYPVVYSNFCKRLRAESKAMAYFIEFMIFQLYKMEELTQFHSGTSIPNFNLKDFLNYQIAIPPNEKIMEFSSFLTLWYEKKFDNQIRTLEKLRDTLLPKLMSGEVRVRLSEL